MTHGYTERDVEDFFDQTLENYLGFWDSEGVLHTGYFSGEDDRDYRAAAARTSAVLAADAGIDSSSYVLDVGCGCGNFLTYLADQLDCRGEGLDLSEERIKFARRSLGAAARSATGRELRIGFSHGSVTSLPYDRGAFSHVVSQDALFLVPDKPRSHAEMYRVLEPGGILALSDFLQPADEISDRAREHVYDRVRWSGGYSLDGYCAALAGSGFEIIVARDLGPHIRRTYEVLGLAASQRAETTSDPAGREWTLAFAKSCAEIEAAIDRGEFGWGMITARKPHDRTA